MVTMRQLAKLAGVSPSTVSRALANQPYVREELRIQIQQLARRHGYRPYGQSETVQSASGRAIGCLVPTVSSFYYNAILQGVLDAAAACAYHVIVLQTHNTPQQTRQALQICLAQGMGGVLMATGHEEPIPRDAILELWSRGAIPVAIDFCAVDLPVDRVATDETHVAELSVGYLYNMGHRAIAYVGHLGPDRRVTRAHAARQAMLNRGLSVDAFLDDRNEMAVSEAIEGIFKIMPHCTAIVAYGDRLAALLIQQLAQRRVLVPREVSVIGCGNLPMDSYLTPPLTTIDQHPETVGARAVEELLRLRTAGDQPALPGHVSVTASLIERASCAPPHPAKRGMGSW